ncbi:hypothetical protein SADUNF_Sadunf12G0016200 [Salix dunnii]|uniref:RING-type E3 ubiquitin transferase n=1 Tax=Salix dunnii TaxID=1413687 RepID=A0A835MLL7_9ROSI|nr:hypothetical protein SADUNF_Sadunf12G0016200 [Salix dunnii]
MHVTKHQTFSAKWRTPEKQGIHPVIESGWFLFQLSGQFFSKSWDEPDCGKCESRGGRCGFSTNSSEIVCSNAPHHGAPRKALYAVTAEAGVPRALILLGSRSVLEEEARQEVYQKTIPLLIQNLAGLDGRTIESYPKIVLGESRRLPKLMTTLAQYTCTSTGLRRHFRPFLNANIASILIHRWMASVECYLPHLQKFSRKIDTS